MLEPIFLVQIFLSFVIGGAATGGMTILAQKLPQKTAGIVISFPTTMVISLFFLWLISPRHEFIASFDIIPVGMSVTILFLVSYIYRACREIPLRAEAPPQGSPSTLLHSSGSAFV